MALDSRVHQLLKSRFGYDQFRPLQEEVIASVLSQQDSFVLMPTGGGKSLCYQLPALLLDGLTLVVSPLIALMKDQVDYLKANGIPGEFINSTLSAVEVSQIHRRATLGQLKLLYVAPERLASPGFHDFLRAANPSLIAIDEAHCISEWGHDFRPDYRNLRTLRHSFPGVPIIALTATATEKVQADIISQLDLQKARVFLGGFNRPNLVYRVQRKDKAFPELLSLLRTHHNESSLVYCFSRRGTEELAQSLRDKGFPALPYHAGLDMDVRRETQEKFIHDQVLIIVATIAFGMGVDKPDIRLVVHYDLPKSLEGYYQETGRAGRDGVTSECVLFYSYGDKIKQEFFIDQMQDAPEQAEARRKLDQVVRYCELATCRRRFLLHYFDEQWEQTNCGGCDLCLDPKEDFDATVIAQKVMSVVVRTGQRFGAAHVIGVLRGSRAQRVLQSGHHQLSVYGIARDQTEEYLKQMVTLLIGHGLLQRTNSELPGLELTTVGWDFLRNDEKLVLSVPKKNARERAATSSVGGDLDQELFQRLRNLRRRLADEIGQPAYIVFGDFTLQLMARYLPQTREALARINGVGEVKLARFGDDFLGVIQAYVREQGLPEETTPAPLPYQPETAAPRVSTLEQTRALVAQKLSLEEIASKRGFTVRTIMGHLEQLISSGEELDIEHLMPSPERFSEMAAAFEAAGDLHLAPVQERLAGRYTYEELALVRAKLRQSQ